MRAVDHLNIFACVVSSLLLAYFKSRLLPFLKCVLWHRWVYIDLGDEFPCSDFQRRQSGSKTFWCSFLIVSTPKHFFPPLFPAPETPPHSTTCSICQELPSAPPADTTLSSPVAALGFKPPGRTSGLGQAAPSPHLRRGTGAQQSPRVLGVGGWSPCPSLS